MAGVKDKQIRIGNAAVRSRNAQQNAGAVPRSGSKVVTSLRKDGKLWYRQMQAIAERARTAATPAESAKFTAAYNRMMAVEMKKQGKTPDANERITVSHPLVGPIADETMGFGASLATQTQASKQRTFANAHETFGTVLSRGDVRGPEPRRKIDDSGIQSGVNMRTVRNPNGQPVLSHIVRQTGR